MLADKDIMKYTLWFDVEQRYKTMTRKSGKTELGLWFDVEQRYKTILVAYNAHYCMLWFDVEQRYKTMLLDPLVCIR